MRESSPERSMGMGMGMGRVLGRRGGIAILGTIGLSLTDHAATMATMATMATTATRATVVPIVPGTLKIIAGAGDIVASPADDAKKSYSSIPGAQPHVGLKRKDHFLSTPANVPQVETVIAWLRVNTNDDTWYGQFLCRGPSLDATFGSYMATCPNH